MKKIILALSFLTLTGCASVQSLPVINAYFMAKFDNNEYMLINTVRTQANLGASKCGTPEIVPVVENIYFKTIELKNYSQSIPKNEETIKMSSELSEIVKGLNEKYHSKEPVSLNYCTTKFGIIEKNAVTIQNVVGAKPR
jgi:hypothetical protein